MDLRHWLIGEGKLIAKGPKSHHTPFYASIKSTVQDKHPTRPVYLVYLLFTWNRPLNHMIITPNYIQKKMRRSERLVAATLIVIQLFLFPESV